MIREGTAVVGEQREQRVKAGAMRARGLRDRETLVEGERFEGQGAAIEG